TPASGGQDHTPLPSAPDLRSSHASPRVHRSPLPTSVTVATPLLMEAGCAERTIYFRKPEEEYFCSKGLTTLLIRRTDLPVGQTRRHIGRYVFTFAGTLMPRLMW